MALEEPEDVKVLVDILSFKHLELEVTEIRVGPLESEKNKKEKKTTPAFGAGKGRGEWEECESEEKKGRLPVLESCPLQRSWLLW